MTRSNRLLIVFTILPIIAGCYTPPQLPEDQAAFLTVAPPVPPLEGTLTVDSIDGRRLFNIQQPVALVPGKHKIGVRWDWFGWTTEPQHASSRGSVEFVAEAGKTYIAKVMRVGEGESSRLLFRIEPVAP